MADTYSNNVETKDGETKQPAMSEAEILELKFELSKVRNWLKKSRENVKSLEERLDNHNDEVGDLRRSNKIIQAQLLSRDAEVGRLRIATNLSGTIGLAAGIGLLIAILMLL